MKTPVHLDLNHVPDNIETVSPFVGSDGKEYAKVNGKTMQIMPPRPMRQTNYTDSQKRAMSEVYRRIAECLPVEGKDYSISFSFVEGSNNPRVSFRWMTQIGADFVRHVQQTLGSRKKQ